MVDDSYLPFKLVSVHDSGSKSEKRYPEEVVDRREDPGLLKSYIVKTGSSRFSVKSSG